MKKLFILLLILAAAIPLAAQKDSLNAMSLNGATGIYVVPTARVGFSDTGLGFNVGYHTNYFKPLAGDADLNHLLQFNISLLKMLEFSGTFDIHPDIPHDKNNDVLVGGKFQFPVGSVPIAFGVTYQHLNLGNDNFSSWAFQIYGSVTYMANIFGWPAETTLVVGHTFREENNNSNIDFGMGFDLIVLPKYLYRYLHFLIDFANFSYSAESWGADAWGRGVFNTGLRVDLGQIPALKKFNLAIDFFIADAFDSSDSVGSGRSFGAGVTFGMRL